MNKVRTCIIGYGRNGSSMHIEPYEKMQDFELVAVCDTVAERREEAAKKFGCSIYENYLEMVEKEKPDLTVIVTRSDQHCEMVCGCLKAGTNVLVTKPWAVNAKEAERMINTAKKTGKKLLPWLPARWGVDLEKIKEIIDSGAIGNVFQIKRHECTFGKRIDWQIWKKFGGGYLLNWGPHMIDQPLQLAKTEVVSVWADLKRVIMDGDTEDNFVVITKTSDLTLISEFSICAKGQPNWVVQGDKGTIFVYDEKFEIHRITQPEVLDPNRYRNPVTDDVETLSVNGEVYLLGDTCTVYSHIAEVIRGETEYAVSLESALRLSRIIDAAKKSSKTGKVVYFK
jgi:predicted dehydrogenase